MELEQIEKLNDTVKKYYHIKKQLDEINELIVLSTAKGHTDGKWQPNISINYQVAYQKNVGGNNYHKSEALNREMEKIVSSMLCSVFEKAYDNIKIELLKVETELSKYKYYEKSND